MEKTEAMEVAVRLRKELAELKRFTGQCDLEQFYERKALVDALKGLGGMPGGYCFCFGGVRDADKPRRKHTGECQECRAALARAGE